jgi:hypothetical protein
VVLLWNERSLTGQLEQEYDALMHKYCIDYAQVCHANVTAAGVHRKDQYEENRID